MAIIALYEHKFCGHKSACISTGRHWDWAGASETRVTTQSLRAAITGYLPSTCSSSSTKLALLRGTKLSELSYRHNWHNMI